MYGIDRFIAGQHRRESASAFEEARERTRLLRPIIFAAELFCREWVIPSDNGLGLKESDLANADKMGRLQGYLEHTPTNLPGWQRGVGEIPTRRIFPDQPEL